jgi:hypothetical protein
VILAEYRDTVLIGPFGEFVVPTLSVFDQAKAGWEPLYVLGSRWGQSCVGGGPQSRGSGSRRR